MAKLFDATSSNIGRQLLVAYVMIIGVNMKIYKWYSKNITHNNYPHNQTWNDKIILKNDA